MNSKDKAIQYKCKPIQQDNLSKRQLYLVIAGADLCGRSYILTTLWKSNFHAFNSSNSNSPPENIYQYHQRRI